jgi:Asp/Glu/hydantoin racemase
LSPIVLVIKEFFSTPILTIDEVMAEEVVSKAENIKILATAKSTIEPSCQALYSAATKLKKKINIDFEDNEEAYKAMKNLDMELHNKLVLEQSTKSSNYDAIILAQASMAHLEEDVEAHTGVKTYSSPKRCIRKIIEIIGKDEQEN